MGEDGTAMIGGLEELLAALGIDDAPVFAEYVQSMVTDAADSEEELPSAVEAACEYVEELAGLEDEGDERLGRIAEELKRHWQEARRQEAQEAEQQTDRAMAASAASLETIQSAMRAYREEDESSSKKQQHNQQSSEEAQLIKAATLARANASSSSREAAPDEALAADLGPVIDNRAGGKVSSAAQAEVQKKQQERQEHIKASNEVRKAKKEAEDKKKAHRMNMSEAKLKAVLKEEKSEKGKDKKQAKGGRK